MTLGEVKIVLGTALTSKKRKYSRNHEIELDYTNIYMTGVGLIEAVGKGNTPYSARKDLCKKIQGRLLSVTSNYGDGKEINIKMPPIITP